jgi:hypothetical protein
LGFWDDIALTILTEVASIYPVRDRFSRRPEALITAGRSAFRHDYRLEDKTKNWGMVSQWNLNPKIELRFYHRKYWMVDKVNKESAVLSWQAPRDASQLLQCGQRIRVYPIDASSASDSSGWYFVTDSS